MLELYFVRFDFLSILNFYTKHPNIDFFRKCFIIFSIEVMCSISIGLIFILTTAPDMIIKYLCATSLKIHVQLDSITALEFIYIYYGYAFNT